MREWIATVLMSGVIFSCASAQYPFARLPVPHYDTAKLTVQHFLLPDTTTPTQRFYVEWCLTTYTVDLGAKIPAYKDLILKTKSVDSSDSSAILLYDGDSLIQAFVEPMQLSDYFDEHVCIADIDGDGLLDLKLFAASASSGGEAGYKVRRIYLLQRTNGRFQKISFFDHCSDERDFNGDGKFEILTQYLDSYKNHSYWTFDVFEIEQDGLVNVSARYGYPIMVQYLYRANYEMTKRITRTDMRAFSRKLPEELDIQN